MPPQKRSIRDFFAPVQNDSQTGQTSTPEPSAPKIIPSFRGKPSIPSTGRRNDAPARTSPSSSPSPPPPSIGDTIRVNTSRTTATENRPPSTSQSSANSAGTSKRIVSNGEQVVLNSDSETDSLPELDWGEPTSKTKPAPRAAMSKPKEEVKENGLRKPPKKRKDGKSFSLFVQAAHKSAETEREIAEVKADLEKPLVEEIPNADLGISEEAFENAVHDDADPEKAKRLYLAMQRTNALHTECVFHFFDQKWDPSSLGDPDFPIESLPNHGWTSSFQEQRMRDQAFLSGFASRIFRYQQLPEELASWIIDQVCIGRSDALSDQYIHLLNAHHHHLQTLLDKPRIDSIFNDLGADNQYLDPLKQASPSCEPHPAPTRTLPPSLRSVCRLLQTAAPRLRPEASSHALYTLFHLCMDHSVNSDIDTLYDVQEAIEALMCKISDNTKLASVLNDVVSLLLAHIDHPVLQQHLVSSLPAKSPLMAYFQRHLALSFLLYPALVDTPLDSPEVTKLIHAYLQHLADAQIKKGTDYMSLAARLTLLDIAIGPGPLPVPYQPLTSPAASQEGSTPITTSMPLSFEEKAFNKEVDALAWRVEFLSDSIVESGSLIDLARLDAKNCSEKLYRRLEHAVRIGGKKLPSLFGNNDVQQRQGFMGKWLGKSGSGTATPTVNGAVNGVDGEKVQRMP